MADRDTEDMRDTREGATLPVPTTDEGVTVAELDAPVDEVLSFGARYESVSLLGEGGMGIVSLAADKQIGRRVAMKRLHDGRSKRGDARARFIHEARVQGQLEHPSIVPVYDLGVDPDGAVYFTMKRVRGTTLADVLDRLSREEETSNPESLGPLPGVREAYAAFSERRLLTAFSNVCLTMDFAHRRGVVHRDLKPGNLMLGDFGEVYVLDWGLAHVDAPVGADDDTAVELPERGRPRDTAAGTLLGTPGYMSPEQASGETHLGPASDIYALGAILFEILALRPLHEGGTVMAILESNLRGADGRPSARCGRDVPPELEAIAVRATAHAPGDRYASAREMHLAVERFLDGERDQALRDGLAGKHTALAARAIARAKVDEGPGLSERRVAMQEIGKALALDPTNQDAMSLMMALLTDPPKTVPKEVELEMRNVARGNLKWMGKIGGGAYLSLLLYLPLLAWCGIRSWGWIVALYAAAIAASVVSFWVGAQSKPKQSAALAVVLLSSIAFGASSALFGPLFVTPALLAVNATGFALNLDVRYRNISIACACLFVVLGLVGSLTGIVPGGYAFDERGMYVLNGAISISPAPAFVLLTAVAIGSILTGSLSVTRVRDKLAAAELRLYIYTWHLRELVPDAVRGQTDPTILKTSVYRRR